MTGKMVTIRLSRPNARLLAQNIDGWCDAGACKGGLEPDERRALNSAYDQIARQMANGGRRDRRCDCQNPEPESGVALVSEDCPIHGALTGVSS